jgi:putative exporter of polyketide antibiotics
VAGNGLNFGVVLLSLGLVAVLVGLTYITYQKRDLGI